MPRPASIVAIRRQIDRIDDQLLRLLNRRAHLALAVAAQKAAPSRGDLRAGAREGRPRARGAAERRAARAGARARDLPRDHLGVRAASRQRLRVAYLGPQATFDAPGGARSSSAAAAEYVPSPTVGDVFRDVERGRAELGVVPVENSTEGMVAHTLDLLVDSPLAHQRRGGAARPPLPARAAGHGALAACAASSRIRRRWRSAGSGSRRTSPGVPTDRGGEQRARGGARGDRARARRRSPAEAAASAYGLARPRRAASRTRPATSRASSCSAATTASSADRRRQDLARAAACRDEVGRAGPDAAAVRHASHRPDQDRVAAAARAAVGVRTSSSTWRGIGASARVARALAAVRAARAAAEGPGLVPGRAPIRSRDDRRHPRSSCPSGSARSRRIRPASRSRSSSASSASRARSSSPRTRTRSVRRRRRSRRARRRSAACTAIPTARRSTCAARSRERLGVVAGRHPGRQRLERDHRARRAHLPAAARRGGDGRPGLRHLPHGGAGGRRRRRASSRCATSRTTSRRWPRRSRRATRLVFLANPNNPTGTIFRRREWEAFLRALPPRQLIVVADDAYAEYVEDPEYPDTLARARRRPVPVVTLRTFSKIYGLAGLRIGYGVAPARGDRGDAAHPPAVQRERAGAGRRARGARRRRARARGRAQVNREGMAYAARRVRRASACRSCRARRTSSWCGSGRGARSTTRCCGAA